MNIYLTLFICWSLSFYSFGCTNTDAYKNFSNAQVALKTKKESDVIIYNKLKELSEQIEDYCPKADEAVYEARNNAYAYFQMGKKIKASNIYECDSISSDAKCIKKYHSDWDWTSRAYPRSTIKLMRPLLHSGKDIYLRTGLEGYFIRKVYLNYMKYGKENLQLLKFRHSVAHDYNSVTIPLDNKHEMYKPESGNSLSNSWLIAIYENAEGKFIKVVWYYSGI